ncbi:hypothetical protein CK203_039077 [Vitis vinifera]|uniref:Uncharacterized protein n=1 Tax=Vitis vinifera TaxID=29760 RepID=A0A438IFQ8_VITVI|nr:hypothetical protein CK203_039077 [Vitis vinifera]
MEKQRELGNDNGGKEPSSIWQSSGSSGSAEASVKLKSSRDVKKPPRGSTFFDRFKKLSSKGSQTTNLIQEPVTLERDSRPLLFKFNEVLELMLVCWVFMDNVMP